MGVQVDVDGLPDALRIERRIAEVGHQGVRVGHERTAVHMAQTVDREPVERQPSLDGVLRLLAHDEAERASSGWRMRFAPFSTRLPP